MNPVNANVVEAVRGFSMCNEAIHISRLNISYRLTKQALKDANVPESGYVKVWRIGGEASYTEYSFSRGEADDAGEEGLQTFMFIDIANNPDHYQGLIDGMIIACHKVEQVVVVNRPAVVLPASLQRVIDECRGYYEVQRHAVNLMNVIMRSIDDADRDAFTNEVKHVPRKKAELHQLFRQRFGGWKIIKHMWKRYAQRA